MEKVDIYEYDRKNRERVVSAIEESNGLILSWSYFSKNQTNSIFPAEITALYIDLSSLFYNEDRSDSLIALVEIMLNAIQQVQPVPVLVIIERQYSGRVKDLLYYKINNVLVLESYLGIEMDPISNIVDIDQTGFDNVLEYLNQNLFGNTMFKRRLKEELTKYALV